MTMECWGNTYGKKVIRKKPIKHERDLAAKLHL